MSGRRRRPELTASATIFTPLAPARPKSSFRRSKREQRGSGRIAVEEMRNCPVIVGMAPQLLESVTCSEYTLEIPAERLGSFQTVDDDQVIVLTPRNWRSRSEK
jgi:hypothetical protein